MEEIEDQLIDDVSIELAEIITNGEYNKKEYFEFYDILKIEIRATINRVTEEYYAKKRI